MIIAKRLKGKAIAAWLGPAGDAARRAVATVKSQLDKSPKKLAVYLDAGDPWSYVTAQAVSRLVEAYPVELAVHIVTPPLLLEPRGSSLEPSSLEPSNPRASSLEPSPPPLPSSVPPTLF